MACGRDLEALHPAREGDAIGGLDDELESTGPDREMNDSKVGAPEAALQRTLDRAPRALIVERPRAANHARDHVDRMARR